MGIFIPAVYKHKEIDFLDILLPNPGSISPGPTSAKPTHNLLLQQRALTTHKISRLGDRYKRFWQNCDTTKCLLLIEAPRFLNEENCQVSINDTPGNDGVEQHFINIHP